MKSYTVLNSAGVEVETVPYLTFANIVERARREVLREPEYASCASEHVVAMSLESSITTSDDTSFSGMMPPWGERYVPNGPIVVYQMPFEWMPDRERYYQQVKDVIRHEFRHARGDHDEGHGDMVWLDKVGTGSLKVLDEDLVVFP